MMSGAGRGASLLWGTMMLVLLTFPTVTSTTTPTVTSTTTPTITSTTMPATNASTGEEVGDVRLPRTLKPLHYLVRLQPFINGNFSIHGHVDVDLLVLEATRSVILHMTDIITLNHTTKLVESESGQEQLILQQQYSSARMLYIVHLQKALMEGTNYTLSLDFVGTLGEIPRGFYWSSYIKENGVKSWVASTQFQATDARRAFPCFDEPGLKATFKIYLAREEHMTALSNMPLVVSTPIEDQEGWLWDEFQLSVPMSTYLVAFVVSDFPVRVIGEATNGTLLRVWVRESEESKLHYGSEVAQRSLEFFEGFFGVDFPLPKLDFICPPEMSPNAMENWGLVTYRESGLLYDPSSSSASQKQWTSYLVAHELAHQWFGNLVTMTWWTDLWLNEGFATYMADVAIDNLEPSWRVMDQFVVARQQAVMALDALRSSHPVSVPVHDPAHINEIFDTISYNKGASIIRMMRHFLTESAFRRGLRTFLRQLMYKNADQDDLWLHLTEAAHKEETLLHDLTVKTIMDTWTLQKGFPVVTVSRVSATSAVVTQEYFVLDKTAATEGSTTARKWWIPVTSTTQMRPEFNDTSVRLWLSGDGTEPVSQRISVPEPHYWVIFNVKQTGYYRVNYDQANWELLIQQLQEDHRVIHVTNRAQIIDDAFNLARAGRLSYKTALATIAYLGQEEERVPWEAAFFNFKYLFHMFSRDPSYGALRDYLMSVVLPAYERLGFEEVPEEDLPIMLLRSSVLTWACYLGHPDCRIKSLNLFRSWMANPETFKGISANVAATVYCTALKEGGELEWNFAWRYSRTKPVPELKDALSCTTEIWLLLRYLEGAFNATSSIRRQDAANTFMSVASDGVGTLVAWDYMRANWQNITDYIGNTFFALPKMVEAVTRSFNTPQLLHELEEFEWVNRGRLLTAERATTQALEATRINVAWRETNRDTIVDWLRQKGFSSHLSDI
ncbi:aminopeptidase N isoform X1 [Procambarus clarkii]|uniref:aminopeptidase N isoform X1 n=1 Tax=Procambarus clarkii TaxID=6728 RepID=UPI003742A402